MPSLPILNLKGTPCPLNYAKAKIALESLEPGERLEILLDPGEPFENVSLSLEIDGHEVLLMERETRLVRLLVIKKKDLSDVPDRNTD